MAAARQTQGAALSPECAVAARPGYEDLHGQCRRTGDVPLPHATGLLLVHRCTCPCHGGDRERPQFSQGRTSPGTRTARPAPERTADGTGAPLNATYQGGFAGKALFTYRYSYRPAVWERLLTRAGFAAADARVLDAPQPGYIGTLLVRAVTP